MNQYIRSCLGMLTIMVVALLLSGAEVSADQTSTTTSSVLTAPLAHLYQETQTEMHRGVTASLSTPELIAKAVANGEIDEDTGNLYLAYALTAYDNLPEKYQSVVPWDGTFSLLRLQETVNEIGDRSARAVVKSLLTGACSSSSNTLTTVANSTNYHIEYSTIGGGLTINDYITSLETSWDTEITSFGWAAPPVLTSNPPPGNRYHVRIDNLGGGLYGFVSVSGVHAGFVGNNPNTTWNDSDAYASCMVLNQNFEPFPGTSQQALDATTAHEFVHSIQFGYGALTGANAIDSNVVEGSATWMEEEVFDSSNDNYNYLWPNFSMCMGEYTASPYPYWITWRGLTERHGTGTAGTGEQIMQDFLELTSQSSTSNMLPALNTALVNKGTNLADAYHDYAIAVKFNKSCGGSYAYPYCFEEGANYVSAAGGTSVHGTIGSVGGNYTSSIADNYALNWISLPLSGSPYNVTLNNTSSGGSLRGSVVCDTGSELRVTALSSVAGASQSSVLNNYDTTGCTSVVAVVTNQAQTADNPNSCTARNYQLSTSSSTFVATDFVYIPIVMNNWTAPFDSQFNGDADRWEVHSGSWSVDSNYYGTRGLASTTSSASYPTDFSNFDYETVFRRTGSNTGANRIFVRGTPDPLSGGNWWHNGYLFQYTRGGVYSVYKQVAGGGAEAVQSWTSSSAINQGDAWNTLRVVADGSNFSFYINGTLVWTGTDSSLSSGRVGVGMYRGDTDLGDYLYVDYARLNNLVRRSSVVLTISAEQQRLNEAANRMPVGNVNESSGR